MQTNNAILSASVSFLEDRFYLTDDFCLGSIAHKSPRALPKEPASIQSLHRKDLSPVIQS